MTDPFSIVRPDVCFNMSYDEEGASNKYVIFGCKNRQTDLIGLANVKNM